MPIVLSPELRKRVLTAALGVSLILVLLVWGGWIGTWIVCAVVSLAMIWEFSVITFSLPDALEKRRALLLVSSLTIITLMFDKFPGFGLVVFDFIVVCSYFLLTSARYEDGCDFFEHFKEMSYSIFGLIYIVFLMAYLPLIRSTGHYGRSLIFLFLFIVWACDTGAYFAGRKFGKRKLFPRVSPKKTVEGAVGGLLAAVAVTFLFKLFFFTELGWFSGVVISLMVGLASQVGDLCESFLKRSFDKKDSGSLLPGHGGFLDRFDGVVFSAPFMYALIKVLGLG